MKSSAIKSKQKSLLRSTATFASMTFISRILGFIREMVIAHLFGAGAHVDAFIVAFKLPNFMRRLFAEGAFSQAFIPVLSESQTTQSQEHTKVFIGKVAGTLGVILLIFTALAIIASPLLVMLSAPGYIDDPARFNLTSDMLRITFPYLFFISLTALCTAALNCYGYFGAPALTPVLLNIAMISAALFFTPYFSTPIKALAWGVLIAGCAQLAFQIPFLWRANIVFKPQFAWHDPEVKKVVKLMIPALFGASVAQINLYMDTLFATFLTVGSVSWLYFSLQLSNFPLGVFGVAIATVITPKLSRHYAAEDDHAFHETLDWGCRMVLLLAIPATCGLMILAKPLLTTLFQYGRFTTIDVEQASLSLQAFAFGLPAFMLAKIFTASFYARQEFKTPVKIAAISTLLNFILNLVLIVPLAHMGLALSTSLSAYFNALSLLFLLHKKGFYRTQSKWFAFLFQCFIANAILLVGLYWNHLDAFYWFSWHWTTRLEYLMLSVFCGISLYGMGLLISGFNLRCLRIK